MKFIVRGDCTSRRMLMLNRAKFPYSFSLVTNEKAPNALFCDHLDGLTAKPESVAPFIDEAKMGKSQLFYYRRQYERNTLSETGAALLVVDPYSEMNFQLWRHRHEHWRFWVPKAAIRDHTSFLRTFESEGYRTLEQSVDDTLRVIKHIMANNPGMPVLFLPQILAFYPKLANREHFNNLGALLKVKLPDLHVGQQISDAELMPEDLGTGGGPNLTLHYSGETYWRCAGDMENLLARVAVRVKALIPEIAMPTASKISISLLRSSPACCQKCDSIVQQVKNNLQQYMIITDPTFERAKEFKYRSALIDLARFRSYNEYETVVKQSGKGARIRQRNKALRMGYRCHMFDWRLHIPDIHEVNTSTPVRSGGEMRGSYLKTVEQMGGAPARPYVLKKPECLNHWTLPWGVFLPIGGHLQGNQITDEKLVGYIYLRRFGEFVLYSQILGHHEHLHNGVMILLHHDVMQWILDSDDPEVQGIKVVMYAGFDQGNDGLREWKRREAFEPFQLEVSD